MEFPPLLRGTFVRRYKRFFADVLLDDGRLVVAHCANPGSMKSLLETPPRAYVSVARPGRKLGFTFELAELSDGTFVYVNPAGANGVVHSALRAGRIPALAGYDTIRPEVKYGEGSRIDFLLTAPGRPDAYVEVKNVTLGLGAGRSAFPDSVTSRGTKHLEELMEVVRGGGRGVLLFCASRSDARSVEAAADIDPVYAATLGRARAVGVEVLAFTGPLDPRGFELERELPVLL